MATLAVPLGYYDSDGPPSFMLTLEEGEIQSKHNFTYEELSDLAHTTLNTTKIEQSDKAAKRTDLIYHDFPNNSPIRNLDLQTGTQPEESVEQLREKLDAWFRTRSRTHRRPTHTWESLLFAPISNPSPSSLKKLYNRAPDPMRFLSPRTAKSKSIFRRAKSQNEEELSLGPPVTCKGKKKKKKCFSDSNDRRSSLGNVPNEGEGLMSRLVNPLGPMVSAPIARLDSLPSPSIFNTNPRFPRPSTIEEKDGEVIPVRLGGSFHPSRNVVSKGRRRHSCLPEIPTNFLQENSYSASSEYSSGSDSDQEINEEVCADPSAEISSSALLSSFLQTIQSSLSSRQIAGKVLQKLLHHCQATHLYYLRRNERKDLVLDGSLSPGNAWSVLEGVKMSDSVFFPEGPLNACLKTRKSIYLFNSDRVVEYETPRPNGTPPQQSLQSILVIPVVIQGSVLGAMYLTHSKESNAFDHVDQVVVGVVASSLTSFLQATSVKHDVIRNMSAAKNVILPSTARLQDVKLQDNVLVFDKASQKWSSAYCVAEDTTVHLFQTAWDTHARMKIKISQVRSVTLLGESESGDVKSSAQSVKDLKTQVKDDEWRPPMSGKLTKDHHVIYVRCRNPVPGAWIALPTLVAAQEWVGVMKEMQSELTNYIKEAFKIPSNIRIAPKDVYRGDIIGRGAAATVYEGRWNQTHVAIKQLLDQFDEEEEKAFFSEMNILQGIRHPHIVQMFGGFISDEGRASIVFEFAPRGSLSCVLYDSQLTLELSTKIQILKQTCQALEYLHGQSPPIIHRDLKPANILIEEDFTARLADFGLARKVTHSMTALQGTVKWMAPEVLSSGRYTTKADIYSFGLIAWEVFTQEHFFQELKFDHQISDAVVSKGERPPIPESWSSDMLSIVKESWQKDADLRPTATDLISMLSALGSAVDTH